MRVFADYIEESNYIQIIPEDFSFPQLRGIGSYLKTVNGKVQSPTLITVSLDNIDINRVYERIKRIFEDEFSCEFIANMSAKKVFDDAEREARRFEFFSLRAKEIRDNKISEKEFSDFCDVLSNTEFKRSLKTYQLLAAYHIAFSQNACNFSVPGSGKTSTVLAAYEYLRRQKNEEKKVDKLVVIGPLSAFIAWKLEYKECFGIEPYTLEIRGGVDKNQIEQTLLSSCTKSELIIISYGSVQRNHELITYFLKHNNCMLVLDEAHRIKKVSDDAQSNYVLNLAPYAKSRVVLTGTPAANSYVDLHNLYKFIWPFNNVIGYSVSQLAAMSKNEGDVRVSDLINRISPFFIRVKKSDLGLPPATFTNPIDVKMSPIQREIYEAVERVVINKYESSGLPDSIRRAVAIRLRQAASNPALLLKALDEEFVDCENDDAVLDTREEEFEISASIVRKINQYKEVEVPNKFLYALKIIRDIVAKGEKIIIWCEFIGTCDDLSDYLSDNNIPNKILYGKCCQEEREEIIREFLKPEESLFSVVIANPHAVGESISLHTACHNALYIEQGFNAGVYMQSKDRIHRVGLKKTDHTTYYFLQSQDSVDTVVYNRVLEKERKMLELIENEEIPLLANNMDYEENSEEDIRAIIRDYYERRKRNI